MVKKNQLSICCFGVVVVVLHVEWFLWYGSIFVEDVFPLLFLQKGEWSSCYVQIFSQVGSFSYCCI